MFKNRCPQLKGKMTLGREQQQEDRSAIRALRCRLNKNEGGAAEEDKMASLGEDGVPL